MKQGYLTQESERENKNSRKTMIKLLIVFVFCIAVLYFLSKDSIDYGNISYGSVPFYLVILIGVVLVAVVVRFFITGRTARNGSNLSLPYEERTREEAADIIDREASEGKLLVEEYIEKFTDPEKVHGEKVVLLPSYFLIFNGAGKVTAIPRDKIYWICAQVGKKGGPFMVRLLVFTENKIFKLDGVDIEHVQNIADKLYRYMPNIFSEYDPFELSYELEKIFAKNPEQFFNIYENERQKKLAKG